MHGRTSTSRRIAVTAVASLAATAVVTLPGDAGAQEAGWGSFGASFVELPDQDEVCVESDEGGDDSNGERLDCKPAAGSMSVLTDGRVLYFNALEGMEDADVNVVGQYGSLSINDSTRVVSFDSAADQPQDDATWQVPEEQRADPFEEDYDTNPLFPEPLSGSGDPSANDRSLFCADLVMLPGGDILAVGGTSYYHDPRVPGTDFGVVELEGTRDTRIFDASENAWTESESMNEGRWYPSLVTLADGDLFVASGVTRLLKPVYLDDPMASGRNVTVTETRDRVTGEWTDNGPDAEKSLPLYPRMHLLPNGDVFYNVGGQVFNPAGQSYDEALWNIASVYDPDGQAWTDLNVPGLGTTMPGFRGSASSTMLPLVPDEDGTYRTASFLSAGGIAGTSPGTYVAQTQSSINTVTADGDEVSEVTTTETGPLNDPRWYGTQVALPDGSVMIFSGASADEVVVPGSAVPVGTAERFDPATNEWTVADTTDELRTYHNTAMLLPDGRVLVGGHAPIATAYHQMITLVDGTTTPNETRNPTFEVFTPGYMGVEGQLVVEGVQRMGDSGKLRVDLATPVDADELNDVRLTRFTATTHMVDGDQRTVVVPRDEVEVVAGGSQLLVDLPTQDAVLPPGNYALFATTEVGGEVIPSTIADTVAQEGVDAPNLVNVPYPEDVPGGQAASGPVATGSASTDGTSGSQLDALGGAVTPTIVAAPDPAPSSDAVAVEHDVLVVRFGA